MGERNGKYKKMIWVVMSSVLRKTTTWVSLKWQAQLVKMDKICIKREAVVSLWYTKKICPIFTQRRYLAVLPACPFPFLFCKQWAQENREVHTYTHKHKPSITFTFNWWRCQMISFFRKSRSSWLLANKWIVTFCRGGI